MTVGDLICVVKDRWLLWFSWDFLISNSRLFISYAYFLAWRMKSLFIGFKLEIWRPLELCFSFPCASEGKEFAWISKDRGAIPGLRRSPQRRDWLPTPVFLTGESHGQRSLAGYSSWDYKSQTWLRAIFGGFQIRGFPGGSMLKNLPQCRRCKFDPWVRKSPWRRKWQPTPVFLPGESHGQRNLAGYGPWGRKELDTT